MFLDKSGDEKWPDLFRANRVVRGRLPGACSGGREDYEYCWYSRGAS